MSRLAADAARVAPGHPSHFRPDGCPLCGARVLYRGLTGLDCASPRDVCPNGAPEAPPTESDLEYDFYEAELRESLGALHQERWNEIFKEWTPALVRQCHVAYSPRWRMAPGWTWVTFGAITSGGRRGGYEVYSTP